jgi:predicted nucleic acid-binding protein
MYLSSVVRAELTQGAQGDSGRRLVARLARTLERSGRIVAPTHSDWIEAGTAQSKIWDTIPSLRTKRLLNDLLIARTANRVGACIVTANTGDFELLHAWMPTKLLAATALLPQ